LLGLLNIDGAHHAHRAGREFNTIPSRGQVHFFKKMSKVSIGS
jgi:hypothetical protein